MSDTAVSQRSYMVDFIVLLAMLSVACAGAVGLILEAGVAPFLAAALAAMGYLAAVAGHVLLRNAQQMALLQDELRSADRATAGHNESNFPLSDRALPDNAVLDGPVLTLPKKAKSAEPIRGGTDVSQRQAQNDSLARLRIISQKPSAPPARSVQLKPKADIDAIIRRLADDIVTGRKVHDGVCAARDKTHNTSPPPQVFVSKGASVAKDEVYDRGADYVPPHNLGNDELENEVTSVPVDIDATDKLAAVADALTREKLDVFLEPIHGLDDGSTRHFEVSIRLRLADGDVMDMKDYSDAARGSSWLPLIDVVKVSQAKKVALYLLRRGQSGAFISQINGESVSVGASFSDDLASVMGHDRLMSGRLVLSITQDDVRSFSPSQWDTIDRLRKLGFRFAIAEVNSLDMDFEMLAENGFAFAKLDASVFIEGLPATQTLIPPTDVCRYLAGMGLTLVVDGLTNEEQKAKVLGFGAVYGQGMLFGAPRPVKAEALKASEKRQLTDNGAAQAI